jgi:hypothetical protein
VSKLLEKLHLHSPKKGPSGSPAAWEGDRFQLLMVIRFWKLPLTTTPPLYDHLVSIHELNLLCTVEDNNRGIFFSLSRGICTHFCMYKQTPFVITDCSSVWESLRFVLCCQVSCSSIVDGIVAMVSTLLIQYELHLEQHKLFSFDSCSFAQIWIALIPTWGVLFWINSNHTHNNKEVCYFYLIWFILFWFNSNRTHNNKEVFSFNQIWECLRYIFIIQF